MGEAETQAEGASSLPEPHAPVPSPPRDVPLHKRILKWTIKWGSYLATALSIGYSALLVFAAKDELHLVVWAPENIEVYPSEKTNKLELPLQFDGVTARSVRLLSVSVTNYGKATIGDQKSTWRLELEAPEATHLVLVDKLRVSPSATVALVAPNTRPNALTLELGAMQPRTKIDLRLMLVNARGNTFYPLKIRPDLAGLPHEILPFSPVLHLFDRLVYPVFAALLLLMLIVDGPTIYARISRTYVGLKFVAVLAGRLLGVVVISGIGAALLARGLAHVVSWFL
jgi:hypothetical protein